MIISLINKFGDPIISVDQIQTLNEIHEETEEQSRIIFDIKLKYKYADLDNKSKPEILYIQPEFIFEKTNKILDEDQFFKNITTKTDFKIFLTKLIIIGAEHNGFIGGRYKENKIHANRN